MAAEIASSPHAEFIANLITEELSADDLDECLSKERYEKCILSIQRYNKAYFMNIWAELSLKERKMVYNYATEGFINFFNKETMTALIQKGIIRMNADKDRLVLFPIVSEILFAFLPVSRMSHGLNKTKENRVTLK